MRYNSTHKKLQLKHDAIRYARVKYLVSCMAQVYENENFYITKPLSVVEELKKNKDKLFLSFELTSLSFDNRNRIFEIREKNNNETSYRIDRFHLFDSLFEKKSIALDFCEIPNHDFRLAPELEMVYQYIEKRPDLNNYYLLPTSKTIDTFQISTTPITTNLWNGLALVDTFKDIEYNEMQEDPLKDWYKFHFEFFEKLKDDYRISTKDIKILKKHLNQYNTKNVPMTNVSFYEAILFCNKLSEYFGLDPYYNIESYKRKQYYLDKDYDEDVINSNIFDWSKSDNNVTYFDLYKDAENSHVIVDSYFDKLWKVDSYKNYDLESDDDFEKLDPKIKTKLRKNSERYDDDDDYDYNEFKGFEDLKIYFEFPPIYDQDGNKIVYNSEHYYHCTSSNESYRIGFKNVLDIRLNNENPINEKATGFRLPFSWELLSIISLELQGFEKDVLEFNELTTKHSNLNLFQYERLTPDEQLFLDVQYGMRGSDKDIFCSSTKQPYLEGVYDIVGNVYKWVNDTFFIDKKHIEGDSECTDGQYENFFGGTAIAFGCSYKDDNESLKRQGRDDKGNINITHDNLFRRLAIKQGYEDVGFFVCRNTIKD